MTSVYIDIDEFCCRWLENLVSAGELPTGLVLHEDVTNNLLYKNIGTFDQVHLFCGIGGWPLALKLAGWPDNEPVWTASCPCQPFSFSSQNRKKTADDRHLWPWLHECYIQKYQPPTIFGEQVSGPDGLDWMYHVKRDLQSDGYQVACIVIPASIFATHRRNRLFWVADSSSSRLERFEQRRKRLRESASEASAKRDYNSIRARFQTVSNPDFVSNFNGIPRPMDVLRTFGNSLVPDVAAEFILSFMECL